MPDSPFVSGMVGAALSASNIQIRKPVRLCYTILPLFLKSTAWRRPPQDFAPDRLSDREIDQIAVYLRRMSERGGCVPGSGAGEPVVGRPGARFSVGDSCELEDRLVIIAQGDAGLHAH